MHQFGLGETNCLSCQALDTGTIGQMFTLNLLGITFTDSVMFPLEMPFISPPTIRVEVLDSEGLQQCQQNCKNAVSSRVFSTYANTSPVTWSTACHNQRCCCFDCTKLHISSSSVWGSITHNSSTSTGWELSCANRVLFTNCNCRCFF